MKLGISSCRHPSGVCDSIKALVARSATATARVSHRNRRRLGKRKKCLVVVSGILSNACRGAFNFGQSLGAALANGGIARIFADVSGKIPTAFALHPVGFLGTDF